MARICRDHLYSAISRASQGVGESLLVAPFEQGLIVFYKPIVGVPRDVRRVRKNEVPGFRLIDNLFKIGNTKLGTTEEGATRGEVVGVHDHRRFRPLWHVEITG